jgi:hypothetical protein
VNAAIPELSHPFEIRENLCSAIRSKASTPSFLQEDLSMLTVVRIFLARKKLDDINTTLGHYQGRRPTKDAKQNFPATLSVMRDRN